MKNDGAYNYRFDTSNGISANENGVGGYASGGSVQWISPENIPIFLTYTADATGYHPQGIHFIEINCLKISKKYPKSKIEFILGSHLPKSPPIPDYILKSIEVNRIAEERRSRSQKQ